MLPDIRFAIGAVLLSTLLIVSALGMAATVRIAHHRAVGPLEAARVMAYVDPADWGSGSGHSRHLGNPDSDAAGGDSLLDRLAAIPLDPGATRLTGGAGHREPPGEPASADMTQPADRSAGAQVAAAPAVAAEGTPAEPSTELSQASTPAAQAAPTTKSAKKKVARKRRPPAQTEVRPPTAKTGYPVTGGGNTFEFQVFRD